MSLINLWTEPKRVLVAVDTSARTDTGEAIECSKVLHLPQARTLFAIRGPQFVLHIVFRYYLRGRLTINYDDVVDNLVHCMACMVLEAREEWPEPLAYELLVAGWSPLAGQMKSTWARGKTHSEVVDLETVRTRFAPWEESWGAVPEPNDAKDLLGMAKVQHLHMLKLGCHGANRLLVAELTPERFVVHEFGPLE